MIRVTYFPRLRATAHIDQIESLVEGLAHAGALLDATEVGLVKRW